MIPIKPSEITPEHTYRTRRQFLRDMGTLALGSLLVAACGTLPSAPGRANDRRRHLRARPDPRAFSAPAGSRRRARHAPHLLRVGRQLQQLLRVHHPEERASPSWPGGSPRHRGRSRWEGWWASPGPLTSTSCSAFAQEERIYRLRCVETWSMVIPWVGFPLARLLKEVEPTAAGQVRAL